MGLQEPGNLLLSDELRNLARRLDRAKYGEKGAIKKDFRTLVGWSHQKLHRELKKVGYDTGRKRRADAGTTSQDTASLTALGAAIRLGVRKNGKATMETPNARALLAANGHRFNVSNGRINHLLRERKLDLASQRQASPHVNLRSLHPNHVHMVDPSLCLLFYTPDGKQHMIRDDEAYKNKPEFLERSVS